MIAISIAGKKKKIASLTAEKTEEIVIRTVRKKKTIEKQIEIIKTMKKRTAEKREKINTKEIR